MKTTSEPLWQRSGSILQNRAGPTGKQKYLPSELGEASEKRGTESTAWGDESRQKGKNYDPKEDRGC